MQAKHTPDDITVSMVATSSLATDTPYQLLPPLRPTEYEALKADIAEHGIREPIHIDEQHRIIAGHHRVQIARELGITKLPAIVEAGLDDAQKRDRALVLELARRHLDQAQKRDIIAGLLTQAPDRADRDIARLVAVSPTTVASVRTALVASGQIAIVSARVGADSKTYPSKVSNLDRSEVSRLDGATGTPRTLLVPDKAAMLRQDLEGLEKLASELLGPKTGALERAKIVEMFRRQTLTDEVTGFMLGAQAAYRDCGRIRR